jgi:hypothetical protein
MELAHVKPIEIVQSSWFLRFGMTYENENASGSESLRPFMNEKLLD